MNKQSEPQLGPKKPYTQPKLIRHGDMRELTQTGTKVGNEGAQGNIKNRN